MKSSAYIVASLGQSTEDAEDSDGDTCDPSPSFTFHQVHSGFLDMKAYLLCSCVEIGTELCMMNWNNLRLSC